MNHLTNGASDVDPRHFNLTRAAYSINDVMEATGLGRHTLYRAISEGRLHPKKEGRSTLILAAELARYLASLPDMRPVVP